ncbi:MAG: hypothetical protein KAW09_01210 [Thermoplasmata archaeon]|nr:hypothetical protein [Thermoplasmata archaeon]
MPCLIGLMMILIGFMVISWPNFLDDYDQDELQEDLMRYGWSLSQIGGILLATGMLASGFLARNISQNTRLGLILGATLVIGLFLMFPHYHYNYWEIIRFV